MISRLYQTQSLQQLFKRSQLAIFVLTFSVCTIIFAGISGYTLKVYSENSLIVLAKAMNERIQPSVVFSDRISLMHMLSEYNAEYPIRSMQVLDSYNNELASSSIPRSETDFSHRLLNQLFFSEPITLNIEHHQQHYGQLIIYGDSSSIVAFLHKMLLALVLSFLIIFAVLLWSVNSVYHYLMRSIRPIVETAQNISEHKDYQLRFKNSEIMEFQELNYVFNELLEKIELNDQQLRQENTLLSHQAHHDALTQLPNRLFFYQTLLEIFSTRQRESAALLFIDCNHFKNINDHYGHSAGDAVLKEMATRLNNQLNEYDFIARLGGDEFAILLRHIHEKDQLIQCCEKLTRCADQALLFANTEIHFSFSIGAAKMRNSMSPEDLITEADNAMYKAKKTSSHWFISPSPYNHQVKLL